MNSINPICGAKLNLFSAKIYLTFSSYLAFGLIIVGQIYYDERLDVYGIPINIVLFQLAILLLCVVKDTIKISIRTMVLVAPLFGLIPTLIWSSNVDYGLYKYINLLVVAILVSSILSINTKFYGFRDTFKIFVHVLAVLLLLAVLYKLKYGFFDREVHFFINGPIVFARLMGLGVISCLFVYRGNKRFFGVILFLLAVIWTGSKGPLLSIIITILFYLIWKVGYLKVFSGLIPLILIVFTIFTQPALFQNISPVKRIIDGTSSVFEAGGGRAESTSIRYKMYSKSVQYITNNGGGTGLGGWSSEITVGSHEYPHNIFLELLVEGGVILGFISLIPFLYFIFYRKNIYAFPAFFFFLAQQFSGDLLDARYLLVFSLLTVLTSKKSFKY